jgi:DNA-binding CsgD family transcriptional regulator
MNTAIIETAKADRQTKRRNTTWTRSLDERLLAMKEAGHTFREIAEAMDLASKEAARERHRRLLSPEPIWRWAHMNRQERTDYIRKANENGRSNQSIAKSLGCAPSTVSAFVSDNKIMGMRKNSGSDRFNTSRFWHLSPDDPLHIEFIKSQDARFCKRMKEVRGSFA